MNKLFLYVFLFAIILTTARSTHAASLVADLSTDQIKIDLGFTGGRVLFYGAIDEKGKIVVVVRGPRGPTTIRRKSRLAGIWVNNISTTFKDATSFYQVMASEELDEWLPLSLREKHQIGVEYLDFVANGNLTLAEKAEFQTALIRNKQKLGHYGRVEGRVELLSGRLFRTDIFFPANLPTGIYTLEAYLIRDGKILSSQNTPLSVSKSGIEAEIYNFAHHYPKLYGVIAIIIAVTAGLVANAGALRR